MTDPTMILLVIGSLTVGAMILTKVFGQVSAARARAMLKQDAKLLDVRSPEEFRSGHLNGAVNVPYQEVGQRIGKIVPDKSTPILVYCLSGGRSGVAKSVLRGQGYKEAHNLGSLARAKRIVEP
jgi:phage shock protein E